jgi:vanillate O-demethylase monooxygenase subunit
VAQKPIAAQLLDQRLVLYRLANGKVTAARDLCLHRGIPLSMGFLEGDRLVCAYHGFRYDGEGRCVCIPAPKHLKHLNPPGFKWRRLFDVFLPFTAKLSVFFPKDGRLHILNAACPVSARKTRVFVPICRNFDKDAPLLDTLNFNHQVFAEDKAIVEQQYPEDLPIDLQEEVHIRADRSSITYRQKLAALGLGRTFTA